MEICSNERVVFARNMEVKRASAQDEQHLDVDITRPLVIPKS